MGGLIGALSGGGLTAAEIQGVARGLRFPRWFILGGLLPFESTFSPTMVQLAGNLEELPTPLTVGAVRLLENRHESLHLSGQIRSTRVVPVDSLRDRRDVHVVDASREAGLGEQRDDGRRRNVAPAIHVVNHAPTGSENPQEAAQVRHIMIVPLTPVETQRVDHEDGVHMLVGEIVKRGVARPVAEAEDDTARGRVHVWQPPLDERDSFCIDIGGVDRAVRSDRLCGAERKPAVPHPDLGHDRPRLESQVSEDRLSHNIDGRRCVLVGSGCRRVPSRGPGERERLCAADWRARSAAYRKQIRTQKFRYAVGSHRRERRVRGSCQA